MILILSILSVILTIGFVIMAAIANNLGIMTDVKALFDAGFVLNVILPVLKLLFFYSYMGIFHKEIKLGRKTNLFIVCWFVFVEVLIFVFKILPFNTVVTIIISMLLFNMLFCFTTLAKIGVKKNQLLYILIAFSVNIIAFLALGLMITGLYLVVKQIF